MTFGCAAVFAEKHGARGSRGRLYLRNGVQIWPKARVNNDCFAWSTTAWRNSPGKQRYTRANQYLNELCGTERAKKSGTMRSGECLRASNSEGWARAMLWLFGNLSNKFFARNPALYCCPFRIQFCVVAWWMQFVFLFVVDAECFFRVVLVYWRFFGVK